MNCDEKGIPIKCKLCDREGVVSADIHGDIPFHDWCFDFYTMSMDLIRHCFDVNDVRQTTLGSVSYLFSLTRLHFKILQSHQPSSVFKQILQNACKLATTRDRILRFSDFEDSAINMGYTLEVSS